MLALGWASPAPIWAAAPPSEEAGSLADADALVEQGIRARRAGDDERALELFLRAGELRPESTRIRVHLAATYQALGRWEDADRQLTLALQDPADPYVQKQQGILADARRAIDSHMATLELSGEPPGAEVWLNGRALGKLPLKQPVRVEAGIYTLEARLPGHYPITRGLALAGGMRARERLSFAPLARAPDAAPERAEAPAQSSTASWLPWTFAGLALAAGAGSTVALIVREQNIADWNSNVCLPPSGRSRGETCASERDAAQRAQTWMWIGAAAAGGFAAGALISFVVLNGGDRAEAPAPTAGLRCAVGLAQVQCGGAF